MLATILVARGSPMFMGAFFEYSSIIWFFLLFLHCLRTRGKWMTISIFAIGMLYGIVLENGGPLGGYFYEDLYDLYFFEFFGYGFKISLVPLATHLGWCNVFYVAVIFWEKASVLWPRVKANKWLGGLVISVSGLLMDLLIDIVATRFNWWIWNENLSLAWFGVPLTNYLAWFWAVYWFGFAWVHVQGKVNTTTGEQATSLVGKKETILIAKWVPLLWVLDLGTFFASFYLCAVFGWIYT